MATWIVGGILALIVAAVIWKMVRDAKRGAGSCGCDCSQCGHDCSSK